MLLTDRYSGVTLKWIRFGSYFPSFSDLIDRFTGQQRMHVQAGKPDFRVQIAAGRVLKIGKNAFFFAQVIKISDLNHYGNYTACKWIL